MNWRYGGASVRISGLDRWRFAPTVARARGGGQYPR